MVEMEMKKLHMGTVSYGYDSMDEVAHQLAMAFGTSAEQGADSAIVSTAHRLRPQCSSHEEGIHDNWCPTRHKRPKGHVFPSP